MFHRTCGGYTSAFFFNECSFQQFATYVRCVRRKEGVGVLGVLASLHSSPPLHPPLSPPPLCFECSTKEEATSSSSSSSSSSNSTSSSSSSNSGSSSNSNSRGSRFQEHHGGCQSYRIANGRDVRVGERVYFFGIIDMLVPFKWRKK
jgi:hypothetical protein